MNRKPYIYFMHEHIQLQEKYSAFALPLSVISKWQNVLLRKFSALIITINSTSYENAFFAVTFAARSHAESFQFICKGF